MKNTKNIKNTELYRITSMIKTYIILRMRIMLKTNTTKVIHIIRRMASIQIIKKNQINQLKSKSGIVKKTDINYPTCDFNNFPSHSYKLILLFI